MIYGAKGAVKFYVDKLYFFCKKICLHNVSIHRLMEKDVDKWRQI